MDKIAIGVDIGGTSIKGGAVTSNGKVLDVFSFLKHAIYDILILGNIFHLIANMKSLCFSKCKISSITSC